MPGARPFPCAIILCYNPLMDEVITLQFDGGSRGNPGPAGIGVVLRAEDGTPLVTVGKFIGRATNNVAEYKALITALEEAKKLGARKIVVRGDSELIVKQMRGEYRVKNPDLRQLYDQATALLSHFDKSTIEHNYREDNTLADKLANLAMDRKATVTDVDDLPSARPAAPSRPQSRPAAPAIDADPAPVGSVHTCPRCGCSVKILQPSGRPRNEIGPLHCVCATRMRME